MEHSSIATGDTLEMSLSGKFTFADNRSFQPALEGIGNNLYKRVVINLKEVSFIDSAALGILLLIRDRCDKSSTQLLIKNPLGQVKQMFEVSRFSELFSISND